jgi:hypothetical protein
MQMRTIIDLKYPAGHAKKVSNYLLFPSKVYQSSARKKMRFPSSDPINAERQLKIIKPLRPKKVRLFLLMRTKSTQTPTTPAVFAHFNATGSIQSA